MPLDVPERVAEYLAAEEVKDADAVSRCFTVVIRSANGSKRRTRNTDTSCVQTFGDLVTVRARLTGEFPWSPVELDHIFKLSGDKIASLEIRS